MKQPLATEVSRIWDLLAHNQQAKAEDLLRQLLTSLTTDETKRAESELAALVSRFWPKRARALSELLTERLVPSRANRELPQANRAIREPPPLPTSLGLLTLLADYSRRLDSLRDFHIFQWTTKYRDEISELFSTSRATLAKNVDRRQVLTAIQREVQRHSKEIFEKGFSYVTRRLALTDNEAFGKSTGGLGSFLAVPIRVYSDQTYGLGTARDAGDIRSITSAFLCATLRGFGDSRLGQTTGLHLLSQFPNIWIHTLPFMTGEHAKIVLDRIGNVDVGLTQALSRTVLPILSALDRVLEYPDRKDFLLPAVTDFSHWSKRLSIALQLPSWTRGKRFLDVECYVDISSVDTDVLRDALDRGVDLIAAPLTVDLATWRDAQGREAPRILNTALVDVDQKAFEANAAERAFSILQDALAANLDDQTRTTIIHNYAGDFPLESPSKVQFFLVHRGSVARLLRRFEGDTGVRLWCSVRRSGKSTACRDLGSFSGKVMVITQTMSQEDAEPELNVFYDAVVEVIRERRPLDRTFFENVIRRAAAARGELATNTSKIIFVLDEYEQLFGRLRGVAREDEHLQYAIVYPLLDQIAGFGRENLVVFLGQEPDQHFVFMDHNQLSPLVKQDHFPLFEHGTEKEESEFMQFLRRVLSEHVAFERDFADLVFEETRGHPYLTVNLMVDLFEWLIERRRRSDELRVNGDDFSVFRTERLTTHALERSRAYGFMSNLVTSSLGGDGRRRNPWLHCVMSGLRRIGQEYPNTLACSEPDFQSLIRGISEPMRWPPAHLLRTAQMANFLSLERGNVKPTIPLLARLAAVARPAED